MPTSFIDFFPEGLSTLRIILSLLWLLAMLGLGAWSFGRNLRRVQLRYNCLMACLEIIGIVCVFLCLWQPVRHISIPEKGSYRVLLLADQSASMDTHDGGSRLSRRESLQEKLPQASTAFRRLLELGRTECFHFASTPKYAGEFLAALQAGDSLPGTTRIGDILEHFLKEAASTAPIGTIVLFSDGRSNEGSPPTEAAKHCKNAGVPVTAIGVGSQAPSWDMAIRTGDRTLRVMRDQDFELNAEILSSFPEAREVTASLSLAGSTLATQRLLVPPKGKVQVHFQTRARTEGFQPYLFRIEHLEGDSRPDNDLDFAAVEAEAPPVFRILFLSGGLDWEQRFLNQFAAEQEQFQFTTITCAAKGHFLRNGMTQEQLRKCPAFPTKTDFLEDFDAIVLDTRACPELETSGAEAIRAFVENKGGGLLIHGPMAFLPESLRQLLPAKSDTLGSLRRRTRLMFAEDFVFSVDRAGLLASVFLENGTPILPLEKLKAAARPAISVPGPQGDTVLFAGMAYGAGRVAVTGIECSWKWRLAEAPETHTAYWQAILLWLAELGKPRIRELLANRIPSVGDDFQLALAVDGDDFLPASNAIVSATVQAPSGQLRELSLSPLWEQEGQYSAPFIPTEAGEYSIHYHIRLQEHEYTFNSSFIARQTGPEALNTDYNEELLRDIARITGGRFYSLEDFQHADDFPLASRLPRRQENRPLASSWLLFAIFAVSFCTLCYLRRRIGLK